MLSDNLNIETQPAAEDVQFLDDQINAFNVAATGIADGLLLACFIRDQEAKIIAGIYGWTWGGCCEIKYLWVDQARRKQGYGQRLLQAAEREATHRGCQLIILDTHSFQAPDFYQKLGYTIIGQQENYPHHHQKLYLRKDL